MTEDNVKRLRSIAMDETDWVIDAADEIERLRQLADDLASHLRGYICQCQMSKCKCGYDDVMDAYEAVRGE